MQSIKILNESKLPASFVSLVWFFCLLPFVLNLFGWDFARISPMFDTGLAAGMTSDELSDALHFSLSGSFLHTILEWSAFVIAIVTVWMALAHFAVAKNDVAIPIISITLFFSGAMDAFHTLAADRLIDTVADNVNLIPFTWAICRLLSALIIISGVSFFIFPWRLTKMKENETGFALLVLISFVLGVIAYETINVCATSYALPETQFPEALVKRPWDVMPLLLYLLAAVSLMPRFYKKHKSLFSHALWISMIPQISAQVYMAFGSSQLFDNNFNIAHFLKILSYAVPLIGLILDHVFTMQKLRIQSDLLKDEIGLRLAQEDELQRINDQLNEFSYAVSHDLKAPLRGISSLAEWVKEDYENVIDKEGNDKINKIINRAQKMNDLIDAMLKYAKISKTRIGSEKISLNHVVREVSDLLAPGNHIQIDIPESLPIVYYDRNLIFQIYRNLIGNAIKYLDKENGLITLTARTKNDNWVLGVSDNGSGIEK